MIPVVCVFGVKSVELVSTTGEFPVFETNELDCRCYFTDDDLYEIVARDKPHVIVTFGDIKEFPNLSNAAWDVRRRWIQYENTDDLGAVGSDAFFCFLSNCLEKTKTPEPLISVFTPAYRTGTKILRPLQSLLNQTYANWEWVIFDDSDDDGQTFSELSRIAEKDGRISVYRTHRHTGVIGEVKHNACMLCRGEYLVELDHDDELTDIALAEIVKGFQEHPEAGFIYTDFAECFEDMNPVTYGKGWGFEYGSYRDEKYRGREYKVCNAPNINPKTIRHIVAAPNHARCWRKDLYLEIGGHDKQIHVADDYEIMVRTFLATRMLRVPKFCYIQYRNHSDGNAHQVRNKEIQRLVRYFSMWYNQKIHERFVELGVDDYMYSPDGEKTFWDLNRIKNPETEPHCTLLA